MERSAELKGLQSRLKEYRAQLAELEQRKRDVTDECVRKQQQVFGIEKQIHLMSAENVTISEHALLRYVQRVYNLDLEAISKQILPDPVKEQVLTLGDGIYPVQESHKCVVKGNVVVTVHEWR